MLKSPKTHDERYRLVGFPHLDLTPSPNRQRVALFLL